MHVLSTSAPEDATPEMDPDPVTVAMISLVPTNREMDPLPVTVR